MVIYWDLVIITNLVVDYAFIKTIAVIFKEELKWYRILIAIILGSGSIFLFLLPIKYLYNLRYVIGIFMGMIAYKSLNPVKRFVMIISFYIINLVFIGSLFIFKIKNIFFLLIMMLFVIILTILEKTLNNKLRIETCIVKIKNQKIKALIDTGNNCYYLNKAVVFLNNSFYNDEYKFIGKIEISTISNKNIINIYQGPKLNVNNQFIDVFYSFSEIENYDIILHNSMGE